MPPKKRARTESASSLEDPETQGDINTKRELIKRLMEGDGVEKDEAKAVSLLEDCVAHGDADSMVILAKCCALGRGIEHNAKCAETLVSEAAKKGNHEARILLQLINKCKGKQSVSLTSLRRCFLYVPNDTVYVNVVCFTERVKGKCTNEHVALVMNIIPCREFKLERSS